MAVKIKKEPLPRNISVELFEAWNRLRRKNDTVEMSKKYGMSRVPFDNALNFGHVPKSETAQMVNKFFKERLTEEKASAEELNLLNTDQ